MSINPPEVLQTPIFSNVKVWIFCYENWGENNYVFNNTVSLRKFIYTEYTNNLVFTFIFYFDNAMRRFQWRVFSTQMLLEKTLKDNSTF